MGRGLFGAGAVVCVWLLAATAQAEVTFDAGPCVDLPAAKVKALEALITKTQARIRPGSPADIQPAIGELEAALKEAPAAIPKIQDCPGELRIQASDPSETLAWMVWVASEHEKKKLLKNGSAWKNPYASIAMYAGSYYDEIRDYAAGERVLRRGLALAPLDALISSELAFNLSQQGRHAEALAVADAALGQVFVADPVSRGLLQRKRGWALGEMGRYDEAIAAYREAIKLRPEYQKPLDGEIRYLEGQKAHQPPAPIGVTVGPPKP
jgi:tetratricopeptide (TPR) repeat protein